MIRMYTKQEIIIRYTREGKSHRQISGELKISRTTVRKYIETYLGSKDSKTSAPFDLHEHLHISTTYKCSSLVHRI